MPKVLRIINRFNLGGPTYNAAYLTRYLDPEFKTMLVGGNIDKTEASSTYILDNLGITYSCIAEMKRPLNILNDYRAYRKIRKIIKEFKPDIVHTHASKAGALGRIAASHEKVPIIVHTFHGNVLEGYFGKLKSLIFLKLERYLATKSNAIIAISKTQKLELIHEYKLCSAKKIHMIPLGFDLSKFSVDMVEKRKLFRTRFNLHNEIAIGIVGRLVPVKNHNLFLEAVRYLSEYSTTPFRAFIIGDGEDREKLETYARELGLKAPLLNFTSWIKEIDVVMAGLDVVALTSINEGTPVSLIEAQAANKPIVSTRVGGIEDAVIEGETALLAAPDSPLSFCQKLQKIVDDPELRSGLSVKGNEFVTQRFNYQRLAAEMGSLYVNLISGLR
jgi:glycosyltransferase involved in cell wall biosynthesis